MSERIFQNLLQNYQQDISPIPQKKRNLITHLIRIFREITDPKLLLKIKRLLEVELPRNMDGCNPLQFYVELKLGCDLRELVFNIMKQDERDEVLNKIQTISKKIHHKIPHILTDIDDTLFANYSGFHAFAGEDQSWKPKKPYPGIIRFYQIFYKRTEIKYSTILSATPLFLKKHRLFNQTIIQILGNNFGFIQGKDSKRECIGDISYKLSSWCIPKGTVQSESLAETKFTKCLQYYQLFPEYQLLFIGDNGQGDYIAGIKMIQHIPNILVFIHNIYVSKSNGKIEPLYTPDEVRFKESQYKNRLFFFHNYLELAIIFQKLSLFTTNDVSEIKKKFTTDIQIYPEYVKYYTNFLKKIQKGSGKKKKKTLKKIKRNNSLKKKSQKVGLYIKNA